MPYILPSWHYISYDACFVGLFIIINRVSFIRIDLTGRFFSLSHFSRRRSISVDSSSSGDDDYRKKHKKSKKHKSSRSEVERLAEMERQRKAKEAEQKVSFDFSRSGCRRILIDIYSCFDKGPCIYDVQQICAILDTLPSFVRIFLHTNS